MNINCYQQSEGDYSNIEQLDGNIITSDITQTKHNLNHISNSDKTLNINPISTSEKNKTIFTALNLPVVASYNCRSLFPKVNHFKTDMFERQIDCAFLSEVWEQSENKQHSSEIEKMLQMEGYKYISTSRPTNKRGGGVALVVNLEKYSVERLDVFTPNNLEVVWGLLKPKATSAVIKKIIVCTFYSPPKTRKNTKLADYLVGTLQMLSCKYPNCAIIMGSDRNRMDITPILNCGLRLKQINSLSSRQGAILDILIMNLSKFYNSPLIAPPLLPDDPTKAKPSDHSVPIAYPHTDRHNPPARSYTYHTYRPLPNSRLEKFSQLLAVEV